MKILIEIFFTKIEGENVLYKRHALDVTSYENDPDYIVQKLMEYGYYSRYKTFLEKIGGGIPSSLNKLEI